MSARRRSRGEIAQAQTEVDRVEPVAAKLAAAFHAKIAVHKRDTCEKPCCHPLDSLIHLQSDVLRGCWFLHGWAVSYPATHSVRAVRGANGSIGERADHSRNRSQKEEE
jgi:hypothetical protein